MFTVLFWNMNGRNLERTCARLAHLHRASVVVLAECVRSGVVLKALNPAGTSARYFLSGNPKPSRVEVFTTLHPAEFETLRSEKHFAMHALQVPGAQELLLCSAHMLSKREASDRKQDELLEDLAKAIVEVETERGHTRTMLIGDLNANPFQYGVYSPKGLHAVSSRRIAARGHRRVKRDYPFFYNPMWRFLGDNGPHPPGSYFWAKAEHDNLFWYTLDQALLRPALLPYFQTDDVAILTHDGVASFASADGRPNADVASDHFPIRIGLDYPGDGHEHHDT